MLHLPIKNKLFLPQPFVFSELFWSQFSLVKFQLFSKNSLLSLTIFNYLKIEWSENWIIKKIFQGQQKIKLWNILIINGKKMHIQIQFQILLVYQIIYNKKFIHLCLKELYKIVLFFQNSTKKKQCGLSNIFTKTFFCLETELLSKGMMLQLCFLLMKA